MESSLEKIIQCQGNKRTEDHQKIWYLRDEVKQKMDPILELEKKSHKITVKDNTNGEKTLEQLNKRTIWSIERIIMQICTKSRPHKKEG